MPSVRLFLPTLLVLLASCAFFGGDDDDEDFGAGQAEAELYQGAVDSLESGQMRRAIDYLQALESNFPFGTYAEQAQLELIYAQFRISDHDAAMASADRFIRLHPEHPNVDYAYYMRGLVTFERETSFVGQFLPLDVTARDPGSARDSFTHFSELLVRYPDSSYAPDARKRLIYLKNLLARHEINVANYYLRRGANMAAANRGKYVVENFQGTPAVPDGLAVMAQAYSLLGLEDHAGNATRVLAENYPDHPALNEHGEFRYQNVAQSAQRSWLNRATLGIMDKPVELGFDTRELYNPEYRPPPRGQ